MPKAKENRRGNTSWAPVMGEDVHAVDDEPVKPAKHVEKEVPEKTMEPEVVVPEETVEEIVKPEPAKAVRKKSSSAGIDIKDLQEKKISVPITLSGSTKKRLTEACKNGASISSLVQLILLAFIEDEKKFFTDDKELVEEVLQTKDFFDISVEDISARTGMTEEEKRSIGTYTLIPAIDSFITQKTATVGLTKNKRNRVYNAIIDRYFEMKK